MQEAIYLTDILRNTVHARRQQEVCMVICLLSHPCIYRKIVPEVLRYFAAQGDKVRT